MVLSVLLVEPQPVKCDGTSLCIYSAQGFDSALVAQARSAADIPVIASSGAGKPEHFTEVFTLTDVEAALGAGIFHREEVAISDIKACVDAGNLPTVSVNNCTI